MSGDQARTGDRCFIPTYRSVRPLITRKSVSSRTALALSTETSYDMAGSLCLQNNLIQESDDDRKQCRQLAEDTSLNEWIARN